MSNYSPLPTVFHYQVKLHFFSKDALSFTEQPIRVSLYGTLGEREDLTHVLYVWFLLPLKQLNHCIWSGRITTNQNNGTVLFDKQLVFYNIKSNSHLLVSCTVDEKNRQLSVKEQALLFMAPARWEQLPKCSDHSPKAQKVEPPLKPCSLHIICIQSRWHSGVHVNSHTQVSSQSILWSCLLTSTHACRRYVCLNYHIQHTVYLWWLKGVALTLCSSLVYGVKPHTFE